MGSSPSSGIIQIADIYERDSNFTVVSSSNVIFKVNYDDEGFDLISNQRRGEYLYYGTNRHGKKCFSKNFPTYKVKGFVKGVFPNNGKIILSPKPPFPLIWKEAPLNENIDIECEFVDGFLFPLQRGG